MPAKLGLAIDVGSAALIGQSARSLERLLTLRSEHSGYSVDLALGKSHADYLRGSRADEAMRHRLLACSLTGSLPPRNHCLAAGIAPVTVTPNAVNASVDGRDACARDCAKGAITRSCSSDPGPVTQRSLHGN